MVHSKVGLICYIVSYYIVCVQFVHVCVCTCGSCFDWSELILFVLLFAFVLGGGWRYSRGSTHARETIESYARTPTSRNTHARNNSGRMHKEAFVLNSNIAL